MKINIYKLFEFLATQVHNKYQSLLRSQIEFLLYKMIKTSP